MPNNRIVPGLVPGMILFKQVVLAGAAIPLTHSPMSKVESVVAAGHALSAEAAAGNPRRRRQRLRCRVAGVFMSFVAEAVFASPGGGGFLMARRAGRLTQTLFDFFVETPRKRRPENDVSFFPIHADFGPRTKSFISGLGRAPRRAWPPASPCTRPMRGCR